MSSSSNFLITVSTILSKLSHGLINTKSNCNKSVRNITHSFNSFLEIYVSDIVLFQNSGQTNLLNARAIKTIIKINN